MKEFYICICLLLLSLGLWFLWVTDYIIDRLVWFKNKEIQVEWFIIYLEITKCSLRTNIKAGIFRKFPYTMNIRKPFLAKNFIFNWWDFMKTYIWTRSWTIRASKSIFYVSINCYSLFTNSRQRLKYSRDFFWTKWRSACYVIIILPSPKQKLYWVEFQRRLEVLLWSRWTNFEIKRSKCIVFLFYWVVLFIRHYFLKISFFHLTSPLNVALRCRKKNVRENKNNCVHIFIQFSYYHW